MKYIENMNNKETELIEEYEGGTQLEKTNSENITIKRTIYS